MGTISPRPLILDAGGLIAFERMDRRVVRLLELAEEVHIPAGVVGQVWRNPARQVGIVRLLSTDEVDVQELSLEVAKAAGHLCGATGTADVVDASVVLLSRQHDGVVLTSDRSDLRRIDPNVDLVEC